MNGDSNIFFDTYCSALNNYKHMLPFSDNLVQQQIQFFMTERNKHFCTLSTKTLKIDIKFTISILHERKTINDPYNHLQQTKTK